MWSSRARISQSTSKRLPKSESLSFSPICLYLSLHKNQRQIPTTRRSRGSRKHGSTSMFVAVLAANDVPKDCSKCNFDERMRRRIHGVDFSFFLAISAPEAEEAELRTICDWGNWVLTCFVNVCDIIDFSIPRSFRGTTVRLADFSIGNRDLLDCQCSTKGI